MQRHDFTLEVRSPGRSVSDDGWEVVDAADVVAWQQACEALREYEAVFDGFSAGGFIDWSPMVSRRAQHLAVMRELDASMGTPDAARVIEKFAQGPVYIPISVAKRKLSDRELNGVENMLESMFYDTFLIMNLAVPGSCDFYGASIVREASKGRPRDISLSSFLFEMVWVNSSDGKWPKPSFVAVEPVSRWVRAVRSGSSTIPKSRAEKVLFALMHLGKGDISPATLIWIFYALETLFETKPGENFRALCDRISLVLDPEGNQVDNLRRALRSLYDLRSAFVHGGLDVLHPAGHDWKDKEADGQYGRLTDACEFGFGLVVCSVQKLIHHGWREMCFTEMLTGVPV